VRPAGVVSFGDVLVDLARMEVTRGGEPVSLEPKAFEVLCLLIEHRDRLVTKDELLDAVWHDTFVTPNVLTRIIAQLRKGLGDDAREAKYIETVSKRGYRFIGPIKKEEGREGLEGLVGNRPGLPDPPDLPDRRAPGAQTILAVLIALGAGVFWFLQPARERTAVAEVAARAPMQRLTTRTGYHLTPALSPDGRTIAYASDATGGLEIYVSALAPGARELAITTDGGQNTQPAWSPDGRWIAFHSRTRRGVWVVPATGGTARQLIEFGSDPSWSPDSSEIVITSEAGGMAGQSALWVVALDGGRRRQLTQVGAPAGSHRAPTWSGSGKHVAFLVGDNRWKSALWVVGADGGDAWMVATADSAADPQFDARDRALYWTGRTADETDTTLWRLEFDPESGRGVGAPTMVRSLGVGAIEGWSLSARGALAFAATSLDMNLWAIDLRADGTSGDPVRLTSDTVRNGQPAYTPDGRVTFIQHGTGRPLLSWVMRADGQERELILGDTEARNPLWSRDGSRILVVRDSPAPALWWVDAVTRRTTATPVSGADINSPTLSPDSRVVAFHAVEPSGAINVWTQPLDGGARSQVTRDAEAVSYPVWSPDGRTLAVEIKRGDQTHVGIVPSGGGMVEPVTADVGQSWPHSWSPDGLRIAFAGERNGIWNIYSVSTTTRAVAPLTGLTSSSGWVRYPAWSPDGARIVFERNIQTGTIWTMMLAEPVEATE
jgi:Tol biopolymer transport system component/DNA-binding winged helix-turn-helix (wHTH) protein